MLKGRVARQGGAAALLPSAFHHSVFRHSSLPPRPRGRALAAVDVVQFQQDARSLVDAITLASPDLLQPVVSTLGSDIKSLISLQPTLPEVLRLTVFYYAFLTRPNPLWNIFDFYVAGPIYEGAQKKFSATDFALREKLGGGNFGVTWAGIQLVKGETLSQRGELTPEQKKRR